MPSNLPPAPMGQNFATTSATSTDSGVKPPAKRPHDADSSNILMNVYLQKRLQGQKKFYLSRVREFQANSNFMVRMGAILLFSSTLFGALGTYFSSPFLAFVSALLPAFASLVASMRQLYQWDKQASLYRDAVIGLDEAYLSMPDMDIYDPRSADVVLPNLVKSTEDVFISEINQWGQIALGLKDKEGQDALNARLNELKEEDKIQRRSQNLALGGVGGGTRTASSTAIPTVPPSTIPASGSSSGFGGFPPPPPQEDDGVG